MQGLFIHSFQSEWLKKRGSLASYMVLVGGFFTSVVIIISRLLRKESLVKASQSAAFWEDQWKLSWESMAVFFLPMGIILAASLITQLEYKNNTWKQLHTTPQSLTTIFMAKLAVILIMLVQCFILFNFGIYLSGVIPGLIMGIPHPDQPIHYNYFFNENLKFFVDCLPILAVQYLLSLRFRNFLVSIGAGMLLWIVALDALSWKYSYFVPYTYVILTYMDEVGKYKPTVNIHVLAVAVFVGVTLLNYILYITRREKG